MVSDFYKEIFWECVFILLVGFVLSMINGGINFFMIVVLCVICYVIGRIIYNKFKKIEELCIEDELTIEEKSDIIDSLNPSIEEKSQIINVLNEEEYGKK